MEVWFHLERIVTFGIQHLNVTLANVKIQVSSLSVIRDLFLALKIQIFIRQDNATIYHKLF